MITKNYLEHLFKNNDSITLYDRNNIKVTVSKEYHFRLKGGHADFKIHDLDDLVEHCDYYGLSLESHDSL